MTPTANIILMFFQTAAARRQSAWTARQLAAAIDKCERSVKTAISQLQSAGEIRVNDAGAVVVPTAELSFPGDTVQPEECCLVAPVEPIDEQLTLFDNSELGIRNSELTQATNGSDLNASHGSADRERRLADSRGAAERRREKLATPVQAAACRVCRPRPAEAIPWGVGSATTDRDKVCTNLEQSLNKPCTNGATDDRFAKLQAAMNRLAETLDNKRAPAPDRVGSQVDVGSAKTGFSGSITSSSRQCGFFAPARPMKQEKNINKSMTYESPMGISYEGTESALSQATSGSDYWQYARERGSGTAPRRRDEALYNYYLADLKRRFPGWSKPIFNPATNQTGNCKWAIETLAAIMAWGAPESVYADVVDFCFGKNRNTSAKNPAAAFLFKVKELKSQYRWKE